MPAILAVFATGVCAGEPPGDASRETRKSVLILNIEQPSLPWVADLSAGMFEIFDAVPAERRPAIRTDYLEAMRQPDKAPAQLEWFRKRYADERFDAIIAVTTSAFQFILPLRAERWPDSAVVLLTPSRGLDASRLPPGVTGIGAEFQNERTVDLARTLFPGTRRVAYVSEDASGNAQWKKDLDARGLEFVDLTGLRLEDLESRMARLPPDTVVFFESYHYDGSGRHFVPRDVLARVARTSNSPVMGVSETMMGHGLAAGWVLDYRKVGAEAARQTMDLLEGRPVRASDPASFSRLLFDDRKLRRFHVPDSRLPEGGTILFRAPSLWSDHRSAVVATLAALAIQSVLIAALLFERRRRRRAEDDSRERRRELAHAGRLTAVGELTASISHEINQPLGAILANAEAAEMLLDADGGSLDELRRILADIRRDDLRASEVVRRVRGLAGKRELELKPVEAGEIVATVLRLLQYEGRRHGVSVETDLAAGLVVPRADEVSLQQVLINLALNGMEAMERTPPGARRLRLSTRAAGDRIEFRVSDAGSGIAELDRARLFQSFFTTKPHGVGLGLSICRSIVEGLGGAIGAANNPGGGATFWFLLPGEQEVRADRRTAAGGIAP